MESDEEHFDERSPVGQIINHVNKLCKKPQIDEQLQQAIAKFNGHIEHQKRYLSNGIFNINFAEAALFIQSCSTLYGKKVDLLWDELLALHTRLIQYDCEHKKQKGSKLDEEVIKKLEERRNRYKRKKKFKLAIEQEETGICLFDKRLQDIPQFTPDEHMTKMWKKIEYAGNEQRSIPYLVYKQQTQMYRIKNYPILKSTDFDVMDLDDEEFNTKYSRIPCWHVIHHLIEYNDQGLLPDKEHHCIANLKLLIYERLKFMDENNIPPNTPFEVYEKEYMVYRQKFIESESKKWQNMPLDTMADLHRQLMYLARMDKQLSTCRSPNPKVFPDIIHCCEGSKSSLSSCDSVIDLRSNPDEQIVKTNLFVDLERMSSDLINTKLRSDSGYYDFEEDSDDDDQTEDNIQCECQAEGQARCEGQGQVKEQAEGQTVDQIQCECQAEGQGQCKGQGLYEEQAEGQAVDQIQCECQAEGQAQCKGQRQCESQEPEQAEGETVDQIQCECQAEGQGQCKGQGRETEQGEGETVDPIRCECQTEGQGQCKGQSECQSQREGQGQDKEQAEGRTVDQIRCECQNEGQGHCQGQIESQSGCQVQLIVDGQAQIQGGGQDGGQGLTTDKHGEGERTMDGDSIPLLMDHDKENTPPPADLCNDDDIDDARSIVSDHDYCANAPNTILAELNRNRNEETIAKKMDREMPPPPLPPVFGGSKILPKPIRLKEKRVKEPKTKENGGTASKVRKMSQKQLEKLKQNMVIAEKVRMTKFEKFFARNYQAQMGEGEIQAMSSDSESETSEVPEPPDFPEPADFPEPPDLQNADTMSVMSDHSYCQVQQDSGRPNDSAFPDDSQVLQEHIEVQEGQEVASREDAEAQNGTSSGETRVEGRRKRKADPMEEQIQEALKRFRESRKGEDECFRRASESFVRHEMTEEELEESRQRVENWRSHILPILKTLSESEFDIHEYGSAIMEGVDVGEKKHFKEVVQGKPPKEVVRYFISSLQLANTGNIDICGVQPGQLANESFEVKLLTKERYHEHLKEYHAPSEDDRKDKMKKIREMREKDQGEEPPCKQPKPSYRGKTPLNSTRCYTKSSRKLTSTPQQQMPTVRICLERLQPPTSISAPLPSFSTLASPNATPHPSVQRVSTPQAPLRSVSAFQDDMATPSTSRASFDDFLQSEPADRQLFSTPVSDRSPVRSYGGPKVRHRLFE
ncbi:unnamed protein product [Acanthoscelides obtectus]|uniref:Condensin-2 complex subunit H2 C-terminal domain-containing protein n=1 Tax=Acanthoscelides obtectus TaxID=200917 RepID=A0A9P0K4G9_ACAOB|nr:unnamed protein product [Acanthoscelides obtectus]CAK1676751.1 Condensin-2 complex subunit H2 [Acanthoscelides obtectus]